MSAPAELGLYTFLEWPTFPLQPGSKVPATPHGCKDATTDVDRIRRWTAANPDANWGLATGIAFDVLDVDDPSAAAAALGELWTTAGQPDGFLSGFGKAGPMVSTPSGGGHLYVAATGLGNRTKFIPGCDWRGVGGYVVAPPSRDHRGVWEWIDGHVPETPLPECPSWLRSALEPPKKVSEISRASLHDLTDGRPDKVLAALVRFVLESTPGQRNARFFWAMARVGEHIAAGRLDRRAEDALKAAAMAIGLGHHEVEATTRSATRGVA